MGSRPCLERIHQDLAKVHGVGRIVRDRELGHQLRKHARGVSTAKRSYLCRSGCDTCRKGKGGTSGRFQDVRKFVGRGRWPCEFLLSCTCVAKFGELCETRAGETSLSQNLFYLSR